MFAGVGDGHGLSRLQPGGLPPVSLGLKAGDLVLKELLLLLPRPVGGADGGLQPLRPAVVHHSLEGGIGPLVNGVVVP